MKVTFRRKIIVITLTMIAVVLFVAVACSNSNSSQNSSTIIENALAKCNDTTNKNLEKEIVKRFLTYVSFDTQSLEQSETFPSSAKQLDFAKYLKTELESIGMKNVELDESSGLYSTLPASEGSQDKPVLAFLCHMDTSPSYSGNDIHTIIESIDGKSVIKTDGKTLLGGDDKAGISEMVTFLKTLINNPSYKHPEIRFVATFDEEIGVSSKKVNLDKINAKYAYTLDGSDAGELNYETWNATTANITFNGVKTHLGNAYGQLKNAVLMANDFISQLPSNQRPETTKDRDGFISVSNQSGDINKCVVKCDFRDFEKSGIQAKKDLINSIAANINAKYGQGCCSVEINDVYSNMKEYIVPDYQFLLDNIISANNESGIKSNVVPIRGGTDGSGLSEMGLPCPNIGAGEHLYHTLNEYVIVEEMESIVNMLIKLAEKFACSIEKVNATMKK